MSVCRLPFVGRFIIVMLILDGNEKKARSGKGQPQKRKNSRPSIAGQSEIKLPKEWTY